MAAASFSYFLVLLFFFSQLLSTAFSSMHGSIDDPVIAQVVSYDDSHDVDLLTSAERQFLAFKREYGKAYPTQQEDDYRFGVFMSNLRQARRNQINDPTAVHGVTKFSDLTPSEFRRQYFGSGRQLQLPLPDNIKEAPILPTAGLPEKLNWTEKGAVTEVKNQSTCDGCWAFSTIAVIEGAHFLANGELVELSEQQLIACSKDMCSKNNPCICNKGCGGGHRFLAFSYVNNSNGVVKEKDYPFSLDSQNDECELENKPTAASIHNYSFVKDEEQYAVYLLRHGPLSVSIDIDVLQPQSYNGRILCPKNKLLANEIEITKHAVALVGYDNTSEPFHWILKNSWGKDWGELGYFRVCKGVLSVSDLALYAIAERKIPPSRQII